MTWPKLGDGSTNCSGGGVGRAAHVSGTWNWRGGRLGAGNKAISKQQGFKSWVLEPSGAAPAAAGPPAAPHGSPKRCSHRFRRGLPSCSACPNYSDSGCFQRAPRAPGEQTPPQAAPEAQRPPGAVFPAGCCSSFPLVLPLCLSASLWRQHGARRCTRAVGVGRKGIRKIPPLGPWGRCSVSSPAVCSGKRGRAAGTSSLLAHPRPSSMVSRSREIPLSPSSFSSSLPGSQRMTFNSPPFRGFSALRSRIGPRGEKAEHHLLVTATASLLLGKGESGGAAPWGADPRQTRPRCDIGDGDHRSEVLQTDKRPQDAECSWEPSKETP